MLLYLILYFHVYTLPTEGVHEHQLHSKLLPPMPKGPRKPPREALTALWSDLWLDILSSLWPPVLRISTPLSPGLNPSPPGQKSSLFPSRQLRVQSEAECAHLKGPQPSITLSLLLLTAALGLAGQPGCLENTV